MPEDDGGGVALDDLGDIRRVCSPTAKAMGVFKFNTSILNKAIESNIIIAPSFSSPSGDVEPAAVTSDRVSAGMLTSATEKVAVRSQTCMLCGLQGSSDNTTLFCLSSLFCYFPPSKKTAGAKHVVLLASKHSNLSNRVKIHSSCDHVAYIYHACASQFVQAIFIIF